MLIQFQRCHKYFKKCWSYHKMLLLVRGRHGFMVLFVRASPYPSVTNNKIKYFELREEIKKNMEKIWKRISFSHPLSINKKSKNFVSKFEGVRSYQTLHSIKKLNQLLTITGMDAVSISNLE